MYAIDVGALRISFSSAVITVRRDIQHHDWTDESGAYARQDIAVEQGKGFATVIGLTGNPRERRRHRVSILSPSVFTRLDLARHLHDGDGNGVDEWLGAMFTTDYPWGKLVAVNWFAMDYVPGGISHVMLPHGHPAVDLGALQLDWPSIEVAPQG